MSSHTFLVVLAFIFLAALAPAEAGIRASKQFSGATVSDQVGSLKLNFEGTVLKPGSSVATELNCGGSAYTLVVGVVVADDLRGKFVSCDVRVGSELAGRYQVKTEGVGRRSVFVNVSDQNIYKWRNQRVEIANSGAEPLFVERVIAIDHLEEQVDRPFDKDDFILGFLVGDISAEHPDLKRLKLFKTPPGTTMGISTEVRYARPRAQADVEGLEAAANLMGWPVLPIMVSWWSGTPAEVINNVAYQQVCYSHTDTLDEGQALKDLLGDSWKLEYGLTVPNMWSNTPWQTLNNPDLNSLRKTKLDAIMPELTRRLGDRVLAYITENEPMYWAGTFPDHKYPVKRENLLADFNPDTVKAAAKDGVTLDPAKRFGLTERRWLIKNLHEYLCEASSWIAASANGKPVYTHALLEDHYPMKDTPHARPAMEMAVCPGFVTGVEMLWETNLDKIMRLREFGAWGLVNREEYDARDWDKHIAMAVAVYACGSRMLNSYNWSSCAPEFQEKYFNGFADSLPEAVVVSHQPAETAWAPLAKLRWKAGLNPAAPWGTALEIQLQNEGSEPLAVTAEIAGANDGLIGGFGRAVVPAGHSGPFKIELNQMTTCAQDQDLVLSLRSSGGLSIRADTRGKPAFKWIMNAARERRRTQVIQSLIGHKSN